MWKSMGKTAAATVAWSLVHSALATLAAKRKAADLVGPRAQAGLYRAFYNGQSLATLAALIVYLRSLPDRELYHARGPIALILRGGQAVGLLGMGWSAAHIGLGRLTGLDGLAAWTAGDDIPRPAEGQSVMPDARGVLRATGPHRHSRHPLNAAMPLVLWLNPRMTTNLLAFNLVATAYLVVGSAAEEARLRSAFGDQYEEYLRRGIPFYLPTSTAR